MIYKESTQTFIFNSIDLIGLSTSYHVGELDNKGEVLWDKHLDLKSTEDVYLRDMELCEDGGIVLAGFNWGASPQYSWVLKLDSLGNGCGAPQCDSTVTIVSIPEIDFSSNISVSPNPATNYLNVSMSDYCSSCDFRLYDLFGRMVLETTELDIINLPYKLNGIYLWEVYKEDLLLDSGRLVIE